MSRPGLTERFDGEVVGSGDPGYNAARAVWNGLVDRYPALVVRPTHAGDVAEAVRFAREQDMVIAVRGGGHSIPGLSTCDGGIVIDLSHMRGVQIDPERRTARAAGGALLGELDERAQAFGLVCPVGVVSHTGVGGLTLGGGMGRLQRTFGLTIDNLLAVELVTADGRLIRASEDENAGLFWGIRGAGANFGIATAFEFRLHPLDGAITHGSVVHPIERGRELAALYREAVEGGRDELWVRFGVGIADGELVAEISPFHCGSGREAERDLAPVRAFSRPLEDSIATKPYLEAQQLSDEAMEWGHRFYMKSVFLHSLADELVDLAAERLSRVPQGAEAAYSLWSCGRAMARVPEEDTAFTGRGAAFWMAAEILWDDPALDEPSREWGRGALAGVEPFTSAGRYVNDVADSGEGLGSVYGEAKYRRLVELKRAWDPDNVFRLNQNVEP